MDGSLYISIFIEPSDYEDKNDFIKFINYTKFDNIKGIKIYCFNNPDKIAKWVEEEEFHNVQVFNFKI